MKILPAFLKSVCMIVLLVLVLLVLHSIPIACHLYELVGFLYQIFIFKEKYRPLFAFIICNFILLVIFLISSTSSDEQKYIAPSPAKEGGELYYNARPDFDEDDDVLVLNLDDDDGHGEEYDEDGVPDESDDADGGDKKECGDEAEDDDGEYDEDGIPGESDDADSGCEAEDDDGELAGKIEDFIEKIYSGWRLERLREKRLIQEIQSNIG